MPHTWLTRPAPYRPGDLVPPPPPLPRGLRDKGPLPGIDLLGLLGAPLRLLDPLLLLPDRGLLRDNRLLFLLLLSGAGASGGPPGLFLKRTERIRAGGRPSHRRSEAGGHTHRPPRGDAPVPVRVGRAPGRRRRGTWVGGAFGRDARFVHAGVVLPTRPWSVLHSTPSRVPPKLTSLSCQDSGVVHHAHTLTGDTTGRTEPVHYPDTGPGHP